MHELSLALEVIRLAAEEADAHHAAEIREVEIEVGTLSGVDAEAFETALRLLQPGSVLDHAGLRIRRVPGRGRCDHCNEEFEMNDFLSSCPKCGYFPSEIHDGQEFRLISLTVE